MNKLILIALLYALTFNHISSQIDGIGITVGNNFSSHTNFDPTIPTDGTFQWNNLNTINIGLYASNTVSNNIRFRTSVNFQQKGYTEFATIGIVGGSLQAASDNELLRNRLSYLTFSLTSEYVINPKNNNFSFSIFLGLENNILLGQRLESEMIHAIRNSYPVNQYQNNWNYYYLNYNLGLRTKIYDLIGFSAFFSRSLSPILKTENLIVKDWIWGISLDLNLLSFFNK